MTFYIRGKARERDILYGHHESKGGSWFAGGREGGAEGGAEQRAEEGRATIAGYQYLCGACYTDLAA